MKRYMLFQWCSYEASGGFNDFVKLFDNIDSVYKYISKAVEKNPVLLIKLLGRLYRLYDNIQLVKTPIAYPTAD